MCALLYLGFDWAYGNYGNSNLVPGLIFVGNFGIPISIAILFFELNVRRDIPIVGWLDDIGVLAIAVSLITAAVYRRTDNLPGAEEESQPTGQERPMRNCTPAPQDTEEKRLP